MGLSGLSTKLRRKSKKFFTREFKTPIFSKKGSKHRKTAFNSVLKKKFSVFHFFGIKFNLTNPNLGASPPVPPYGTLTYLTMTITLIYKE